MDQACPKGRKGQDHWFLSDTGMSLNKKEGERESEEQRQKERAV